MATDATQKHFPADDTDDDDNDEEEEQNWEDWKADDDAEGEEDIDPEILCIFCDGKHTSSDSLFRHCKLDHHFDFHGVTNRLGLDFYGCFKLINYIRSQVAENRCWSCRLTFESKIDLQNHLHETVSLKETTLPWDNEKYLKPFMLDDPLLYCFAEDDEGDEDMMAVDKNELLWDLSSLENIDINNEGGSERSMFRNSHENGTMEVSSGPNRLEKFEADDFDAHKDSGLCDGKIEDKQSSLSSKKIVANQIKTVNKNYFGSYSSFGIHREMISDKVRTDAYRQAILENPSLIHGAVVLDVGCGTGILSLFAAQAGASKVIAVEASDKMASVATQIAKDNGLLWNENPIREKNQSSRVVKVVQGMVEDLDNSKHIQPHSIDVLVSEWMGYCLLYETMLSSVLFARDLWLKPGGAILPDTATMFVAGFGRGGTSIPFWENVYGFNMSCIGKEVVEDAARIPIVDIIDGCDVVTNTAVLQNFDLVTMKPEEMDFTSRIELELKSDNLVNDADDLLPVTTWCCGVVLWFDTGFTSRFCKDMPTVLSTSPYGPKTHWAQTILTFKEPVAMASGNLDVNRSAAVGTDGCPAVKIFARISIVRALQHRSIDISLEIAGVGPDGRKRNWPVQMFSLS